jgi:hypothetical protein
MPNWIYKDKPFTEVPENAFGFVYLITNIKSGQQYIGKKQFHSHLSKKVKGRKNRTHFKKDSGWQKYWSSCKELKDDVVRLGEDSFVREILEIYMTKREWSYGEIEEQVKCDVLTAKLSNGEPAFYNRNIMNRFFAHE